MNFSLVLALLAVLLTACAGSQPDMPDLSEMTGPVWPTKDWPTCTPEQQNMDSHKLEEMQAYIDQSRLNLDSLLIIRGGHIVSETYYHGYDARDRHELYSVTKSFAATLVAIAIDQGLIDGPGSYLLDYFPGRTFTNVDADKQAITLEHVLAMTSGLGWVESDASFNTLYRQPDWVQYMLDLPMKTPPGEQFYYCSGCSHLLTAVLGQASGMDVRDFAEENLFKPLGIQKAQWENDYDDIPIGGWGLKLTPREMAKLGYLYLHNGEWDGKQIVSANWVAQATVKHADDEGDLDYGYQWWTYPSLDAYTALGRYGQTIFVIPWADLVIVTTADLPDHDEIFDLIELYIVPALED
jgi:CubicO group peptidase (beta-lactamase class C family)